MSAELAISNLLVGMGALGLAAWFLLWVKETNAKDNEVRNTKSSIHCEALNNYFETKNMQPTYEPRFEDLLEEETIKHFFPKKGK